MIIESNNCIIKITIDKTYTIGSADNRYYDIVHNPCSYTRNDLARTLSIHVNLFSHEYRIALVGPYNTFDYDCAILEDERLIVLQDNLITVISILDGAMIDKIEIDCLGCNFGIYKVKNGYIIYGEIEITMLDFEFQKKWSFSGRDIFVSITGKEPFELRENSISLYDFEDNHYEIDYNGELVD